jgi:hypothetical protein
LSASSNILTIELRLWIVVPETEQATSISQFEYKMKFISLWGMTDLTISGDRLDDMRPLPIQLPVGFRLAVSFSHDIVTRICNSLVSFQRNVNGVVLSFDSVLLASEHLQLGHIAKVTATQYPH